MSRARRKPCTVGGDGRHRNQHRAAPAGSAGIAGSTGNRPTTRARPAAPECEPRAGDRAPGTNRADQTNMTRTTPRSRALGALLDAQDEPTRAEVLAALCHGITRAARLLGVPRRTLAAWVARHGLEHADGRTLPWPWAPSDANCQPGASNCGANRAKTAVDAAQKVQTLQGDSGTSDNLGQSSDAKPA